MGVDTKGRIVHCSKDVFLVAEKLRNCIQDLQKRNEMPKKDKSFSIEIGHGKVFTVNFGFIRKGEDENMLEKRTLYVLFDCDSDWDDSKEMAGPGLSLILGMWGSSEYLMKNICINLSSNLGGRSFVDVNDCDNEGPIEVDFNDNEIEKDPVWVF